MKIAHFSLLADRGGAAEVARLLATAQAGAGMEVRRFAEFDASGAPDPGVWERFLKALEAGFVPHLHSTSDWPSLLGLCAVRGTRPLITLHDSSLATGGCVHPLDCPSFAAGCPNPCPRGALDSAGRKGRIRAAFDAAKPVLVSPSGAVKRIVQAVHPDHSIRVIPNGVAFPTALPDKGAAKRSFGVAESTGLALFIAHGGESAAFKAGRRWRSIFAAIKARAPGVVGFFVGGDAAGREGDLVLWPYADRAGTARLLAAADALVYPSVMDNHPLLILEAFAHGAPVAAFGVGGIVEQIVDGETGFLVPAGDEAGLAARAAALCANPSLVARTARAAFLRGRERFTVERMAAGYAAAYAAAQMGS